jgi:hypothetical protein
MRNYVTCARLKGLRIESENMCDDCYELLGFVTTRKFWPRYLMLVRLSVILCKAQLDNLYCSFVLA